MGTGTVVQYDGPQKALVEVGAKTAAVLPLREATISPLGDGETISSFVDVGEQYEFQIVSDSRDDGQVTVSIKKIMYAKAWQKLSEQYADDPVFEAEIFQVNRGGAIVLVEGLRAFLPGSHIMGTGGASEAMVGKRIPLKFLEVTLAAGMAIKCMVIDRDKAAGRIALSTKTLEPEPGDMLRDPERVFALADETAAKY